MPQRFYIDEYNLDAQIERLNNNLMEMLEFAYIHEDKVTIIEDLMIEWAEKNLSFYEIIYQKWENEKDDWYDYDEYIFNMFGRNWYLDVDNLTDEEKIKVIKRYQATISVCLFGGYDIEELREEIDLIN